MQWITLHWILDQEKKKSYKGHYWDNWGNLNMDYIYQLVDFINVTLLENDNSIVFLVLRRYIQTCLTIKSLICT